MQLYWIKFVDIIMEHYYGDSWATALDFTERDMQDWFWASQGKDYPRMTATGSYWMSLEEQQK